MKRGFISILAAAVCIVFAVPAFALATVSTPPQAAVAPKGLTDVSGTANACRIVNDGFVNGWHHGYIDANSDGVCDNYVNGTCETYGHPGHGHSFIDIDGDGVCDNYASGTCQDCGHDAYIPIPRSSYGYGVDSASGGGSASGSGTGGNASGYGHHGGHHGGHCR